MKQQPNKSPPPSKAPTTINKKHPLTDTNQHEKTETNPPQSLPEKDLNNMRPTRMREMMKSMKQAFSRVGTVKKEKGSPIVIEIDSSSSNLQNPSPHYDSAMDIESPPKAVTNTSKQPKIERQVEEESLAGNMQISNSKGFSLQSYSKKRESSYAKKIQMKKEPVTGQKECETQTDPHPMGLMKVLKITEEQGEEIINVLFCGQVTTCQRSVLEKYHIHALLDYYQQIINPKPKANTKTISNTNLKFKPTSSQNIPTDATRSVRLLTRNSANRTQP